MAFAIEYQVKGVVVDSLGEGEVYATVRVYSLPDTIKPIGISVTNEEGAFSQTLKSEGEYLLSVSSVGRHEFEREFLVNNKTPIADLGKLVMKDNSEMLGEVTVMAQRPLVT